MSLMWLLSSPDMHTLASIVLGGSKLSLFIVNGPILRSYMHICDGAMNHGDLKSSIRTDIGWSAGLCRPAHPKKHFLGWL